MRCLSIFLVLFFSAVGTAHTAPPPVEAYAQLPGFYDAALSPDGTKLAAIAESKGRYVVSFFDLNQEVPQGRASPLSDKIKPLWIKWANNERVLISFRQTDIYRGTIVHTGHIYTVAADMSDAKILIKQQAQRGIGNLQRNDGGVRQFNNRVVDFLEDDPDHILMAFSDDNMFAPDVQKVDVASGRYNDIQNGQNAIQNWVTDTTGTVRVGYGRRDVNGQWIMTIRTANSDEWKGAQEYPGLEADANVMGFTENPNEMVVARYGGAGTLGLSVYDLSQKTFTRELFRHPEYDVNSAVYSPDGKRLIGASYIADTEHIEFFDPAAKSRMDKVKAAMPGYTPRFVDQTRDGSKIVVKATAADTPSALLVYNLNTGKTQVIGSDYPDLAGITQGQVIPVRYTARDGQKIPAYVTLPTKVAETGNIDSLPFVIMPHGGPYARDSQSFDYLAQFLASRGYGVLQMNFRGSTGYGQEFSAAGRADWSLMQKDVEDGARWLAEKGYADSNRVCIMGWSYGGYAALMGALKNPNLYKCAVSIAGVTDLGELIDDMQKYRFGDQTSVTFVKQGFRNSSDMKLNSPVKLADTLQVPLFLAHGTKDAVVHIDQFSLMKRAVKKAPADVTTLELKDGDHSLMDSENRLKLMKGLDKFLAKNLGKSEFAP